jgi:hypothetical protein
MGEVNVLPAAAFEAIKVAQATYGLPDLLVSKIAQCSESQIRRTRQKVGWTRRKVSLAYLRGQAAMAESRSVSDDARSAEQASPDGAFASIGDVSIIALKGIVERLLLRLTELMCVEDPELLDPTMPKQV